MPTIQKSAVVPYSQKQMYQLVDDIEGYPHFIPWCVSSEIISRTDDEVRATLTFASRGMQKSFTTLNRLQPHKMMEIRLLHGPFKQLEGFWRFESHKNSHCMVQLDLEFEFSSRLLAMMFGPIFNQVASTLVDAFVKRAHEIYGKGDVERTTD